MNSPAVSRILLQNFRPIIREAQRCIRWGINIPSKPEKSPEPIIKKKKSLPQNKFAVNNNPGINRTLEALRKSGHWEEGEEITEEDVEISEPDFSKAHLSYKEHIQEMKEERERKHLFNVCKKAFKQPKSPNMLTYAEKLQIKFLHNDDPEVWTEDKLAASFPADPLIIKKVLKANWKAASVGAVIRHDRHVERNWEAFKKNELDVDPSLKQHLLRFSDRSHHVVSDVKDIKKMLPHLRQDDAENCRPLGEFAGLVADSRPPIPKEQKNEKIVLECKSVIDEGADSKIGKQHFTLDALRDKLSSKKSRKTKMNKILLQGMENGSKGMNEAACTKFVKSAEDVVVSSDYNATWRQKEGEDDNYPLRIEVPDADGRKNKRRLYKVQDRFYDEKGYFLYRVPGLVSN